MANDNTIPQPDLDKIERKSVMSEYPVNYEAGASFGYNLRNAEVQELKKENELLEAREVAWNNKVLKSIFHPTDAQFRGQDLIPA